MKTLVAIASLWLGCQFCIVGPAIADETARPSSRQTENGPGGNAPQAFIANPIADLGEVRRGKVVSFEFTIENRGKSALEITTKPNCGCTVVEHEKVIPPGQQGKIKTELRTSGLGGEFQKSIQVATNDPARRSLQLILSGRVVNAVQVDRIPTVNLKMDAPTEFEIRLRTIDQVEMTGVSCATRFVQAKIQPQGEREYRLAVVVADDAPVGRSNFDLLVATNSELEPVVPITVSCMKGIEVIPPTFGFGSNTRSGSGFPTSTVVVRKAEGGLQIRTVSSNDPNLDLKVSEVRDGLYRLVATYRGEISNLGAKSFVIVETDNPNQPRIQIPIKSPQRNNASKPGLKSP